MSGTKEKREFHEIFWKSCERYQFSEKLIRKDRWYIGSYYKGLWQHMTTYINMFYFEERSKTWAYQKLIHEPWDISCIRWRMICDYLVMYFGGCYAGKSLSCCIMHGILSSSFVNYCRQNDLYCRLIMCYYAVTFWTLLLNSVITFWTTWLFFSLVSGFNIYWPQNWYSCNIPILVQLLVEVPCVNTVVHIVALLWY